MSAPDPSTSPLRLAMLAILSVAGLCVSLWTTWFKFRADYLGEVMGCTGDAQATWLSCDEALSSSWSMIGSIPLTVLSAALFIVVLALCVMLHGRSKRFASARPLLLLVAALALVVCVGLASYSLMFFTHVCPYCVSLYVISGALLALAAPQREALQELKSWSHEFVRGVRAPIDAALLTATLFTAAVGVQMVAYRYMAGTARAVLPAELPPTPSVRHRLDGAPREIVMLFVDPACSRCRTEVREIYESLARFLDGGDAARWRGIELWAFPVPFAVCDPRGPGGWFVDRDGRPLSNADAEFNGSCIAARTIECVAKQAPEHGFEALAMFYSLHDKPPYFTYKRLARSLQHGLKNVPLDFKELQRCVDDPSSLARIASYQAWFARWCQQRPNCGVPQALVVPVVAGVPRIEQGSFAGTAAQLFQTLDTSPLPR
jgi:uncharacterized membrane protein